MNIRAALNVRDAYRTSIGIPKQNQWNPFCVQGMPYYCYHYHYHCAGYGNPCSSMSHNNFRQVIVTLLNLAVSRSKGVAMNVGLDHHLGSRQA